MIDTKNYKEKLHKHTKKLKAHYSINGARKCKRVTIYKVTKMPFEVSTRFLLRVCPTNTEKNTEGDNFFKRSLINLFVVKFYV